MPCYRDLFDRSRLEVAPLADRQHLLDLSSILELKPAEQVHPELISVAAAIQAARQGGSAIILMMGAHVLRSGVQRYLVDLMERGLLSCIAMNGAGVIHDFEFSLIGATTESVADYIQDGRFGFWRETGRINDIVSHAAEKGQGLGQAVGETIQNESFPHREFSVLATGYRLGIPVTVHVGIGYDIVHQLPNCNGAAYGATSYRDFLRFTRVLEDVPGGVVMNFGSSVMAPEIYLKALSMVRNVARQEEKPLSAFTTLVCDLAELPAQYQREAARDNPSYYFRPWKTMLVRTTTNGGASFYVRGKHADTIPQLWTALSSQSRETLEGDAA